MYVRDFKSARPRKKNRHAIVAVIFLLIILAGLVWAATVLFPVFSVGRERYESWSYKRAVEIWRISSEAISLRGQGKSSEFSLYKKQISVLKEDLLKKKAPSKYLEAHSILLGATSLLEIMTQKAEKKIDYYAELVSVKELLEKWIGIVSREKEMSEFNFSRIKLDLAKTQPKAEEKPEQPSKSVRRGLAIISFTTKPKPVSYDSATKTYFYKKTDVMSVTVEVQNQGEVKETSIVVRLTLRSSISGQKEEMTEEIKELKAGERKPVTFENILPDTSDGAENLIKVFVEPVPQEKYLFNNERTWRFRWKK